MPSLSLVTLFLTSFLSVSARPTPFPLDLPQLATDPAALLTGNAGSTSAPSGILAQAEHAAPIPDSSLLPSSRQSKLVTLPVARRFNSTGAANVLKFDQARAKAIRQRAKAEGSGRDNQATDVAQDEFTVPASSQVVSYVVSVRIFCLRMSALAESIFRRISAIRLMSVCALLTRLVR